VVIPVPEKSGINGMNTERKHLMYGSVIYMRKIGSKTMTNQEYLEWLEEALELVKTLPLASDMWYLKQQRKEAREIAWIRSVHWDGVVRNQHQSTQDR
jgi:hypothetical protein